MRADMWHGSGAMMGGILLQTGTLLLSVVMLRSPAFGKLLAYLGIVTHGLDLAHLLTGLVFPTGGVILIAIAGPLYFVVSLAGPRLFSAGKNSTEIGEMVR